MKMYPKLLLVIFIMAFTSYINAQERSVDEILNDCQEKREHDKMALDQYRRYSKSIYCGDTYSTFEYLDNSLYQKLKGKGIMPDSSMQVRILQLLNNEFYEGELEMLINDELKSDKYVGLPDSVLDIKKAEIGEKYSSELPLYKIVALIRACELIDNKQIHKKLEEMYNNLKYADYKNELLKCLLLSHVEPYTSECLKHSKYNRSLSGDEQFYNIHHLEYIYTQESFREIAEYLFSEAYWENHIMDNRTYNNLKKDSANSIQEVDSVVEIVFDTEDILDFAELEKSFPEPGGETITYNYYNAYAFYVIAAAISNEDFYKMLGLDRNAIPSMNDDFMTKERCQKMYNWMKKNYGKYKFRNRWK